MGAVPAPFPPGERRDDQLADFAAGSADEGLRRLETSTGPEIFLTPTVGAQFGGPGPAVPKGWLVEPWKEGASVHAADRELQVEGAKIGFDGIFGSPRSLEFAATFTTRPHQHVGFGTDLRAVPWVTFSTKFGHGLYARSHFFQPEDSRLPAGLVGTPHRFRIDWNVIDLEFWVDGKLAVHQLVPVVGYMRPVISNGSLGGGPLAVEWMRMSPYAAAGTFASRIHDAGTASEWTACHPDADVPLRTSLTAEVRTGDGPIPDGRWTGWCPVDDGGRVAAAETAHRFAQYRLRLSTGDPARTPVVRGVTLRYTPGGVSPVTGAPTSPSSPSSSSSGSGMGGGTSGG